MGIDAALFSGPKCYFFKGARYIRVTRGETGPGTVDPGYPAPISNWGWPSGFGGNGIDAALYSGSKTYFFKGNRYIRVTRGETGPGTVDPGYPAPISNWGWPSGFGANGIDAALNSGSKTYFFKGDQYIRVTRGETGPGTVDPGYPAPISNWGWDREFIVVHFKSLLKIDSAVQDFIDDQFGAMRDLFTRSRIDVRRGSIEDLSGDSDLDSLLVLDVGACLLGRPTEEHEELFAHRGGAADTDLVIYIVQMLDGGDGNLVGCATHPSGKPGAAVVVTSSRWLLAHEVGHVLSLRHVPRTPTTNSDFLMWPNTGWTNVPPDVSAAETTKMLDSALTRPDPF
ncbi:hemopexin repeat-containing protein [Actinomadura kijaniata]|uniref:hemopexin repeat-containing protein n=1 Tax=Actinomadura kijaniata TaxID=46161 RepID=UPI0009FCF12C|nr:hemopexin repeat-containing protein [Actinomadura kijaniata]